jgi:hypothetical protein
MVPAELVKGAVPMDADAAAKLSDFGQQLLARHMVEIDVRMCIVINHRSAFLPAPG